MIIRPPPEDSVFPRPVRGRGPTARRVSHSQDKKLGGRPDSLRWSLRRLVLSTLSVNAVLWAATIFIVWLAVSL